MFRLTIIASAVTIASSLAFAGKGEGPGDRNPHYRTGYELGYGAGYADACNTFGGEFSFDSGVALCTFDDDDDDDDGDGGPRETYIGPCPESPNHCFQTETFKHYVFELSQSPKLTYLPLGIAAANPGAQLVGSTGSPTSFTVQLPSGELKTFTNIVGCDGIEYWDSAIYNCLENFNDFAEFKALWESEGITIGNNFDGTAGVAWSKPSGYLWVALQPEDDWTVDNAPWTYATARLNRPTAGTGYQSENCTEFGWNEQTGYSGKALYYFADQLLAPIDQAVSYNGVINPGGLPQFNICSDDPVGIYSLNFTVLDAKGGVGTRSLTLVIEEETVPGGRVIWE